MEINLNCFDKNKVVSNKTNDNDIWYNIKSLNSLFSITKEGKIKNNKTNKILTPSLRKNGYVEVNIRINGIKKVFEVHRLLAETFVVNENPDLYTEVDHINRIKSDNRIENLRWVNRSINMKNVNLGNIKVYKTDLDYNIIKVYNSLSECVQNEKISFPTLYNLLNKNCRGKRVFSSLSKKDNIYGNYRFIREKDYLVKPF